MLNLRETEDMSDGSTLDRSTIDSLPLKAVVLPIEPGHGNVHDMEDYNNRCRVGVTDFPMRIRPWPDPPNSFDLIMAKLDKLDDTMMQILDFLTTPSITIEPVRKPLVSALSGRQRAYLRMWVEKGDAMWHIALQHGVSSSSVQRSLAAAAKKLGYLTTADLRKAIASGELRLE